MSDDIVIALSILTEKQVNTARPDLRDDLLQVGCEAGLIAQGTFKRNRGFSRKNWLIMHMRRDMIRFLENEAKHSGHLDIEELVDLDDIEELLDEEFQYLLEDSVDLEWALQSLSETEYRAVDLHFFQDLSYNLTAESMSLTKQEVYRLIKDSVAKIQHRMLLRKYNS